MSARCERDGYHRWSWVRLKWLTPFSVAHTYQCRFCGREETRYERKT